jgi:hypothetical protein
MAKTISGGTVHRLSTISKIMILILTAPAFTFAQPRTTVDHHPYELSHEVELQGTISQLVRNPKGMPFVGTYLFLQAPSGNIPVQLGLFRPKGSQLAVGDVVIVVGIPTSVRGKTVVLARIVKRGNDTFTIRNRNGIALRATRRSVLHSVSGRAK